MQINQQLLDKALGRFPYLLKQCEKNTPVDLIEAYAACIIGEYHLLLIEQEKANGARLAQAFRLNQHQLGGSGGELQQGAHQHRLPVLR
jgi:hypothetical protein